MPDLLRSTADLAYRFGLGPRPSDTPDHRLVEVVEGPQRLEPGRALDLGCGTGRNTIYLARHGWDATGVEMSGQAVKTAERKATAAGLSARFRQGDVTKLAELGLGDGYRLLMDGGCYHMVPHSRRDAYAASVSQVAEPGALLIIVGFADYLSLGLNKEELVARFAGWELLTAGKVPGEQMREYVSGPAPLRALLRRGAFHPMRYELRYTAS
jgi:SAM-dependent methyltransferase